MTDPISLDSLIDEHKNRVSQLRYSPSPPGTIGGSYCYYDDNAAYKKWLATTKRVLGCTFPNDRDIDEFEIVSTKTLCKSQQEELLAILEAFRVLPEIIENKQQKADSSGNVFNINNHNSNSQSQQQTQSVQIFLEAIKDELTGKQQKELKSIVDEDMEPEVKRTKIFDKIKSFGIDTLSNIVANIATNPAVWG